MELLSSSKSHSKTASMAENPRKEMEKTTQLQENFSAATKSAQSSIHLNDSYHGPTDDLLTCDGVCYKTRPLCLEELKRVAANFTTREAANMTHRGQTWLQMAQAALGNMNEYKPNLSISALRPTVSSEDSFAWSTPEGAAAGMTGKVHNSLSLPEAMCGPLLKSHIQRDPLWVGYSITLITAKAAGCSFDMSVTRATSPVSRINQVQVMTGLQPVRVSNLATAALSGLFYLAHHKPEKMVGEARAVSTFFHGLAYADELSCPDQGGEWAHFGNLAGPLLAAEKLLSGPLPKLFEKVLFSYHCCTIKPQPPPLMSTFNSTSPSLQTLFLARFYDSTLPSYLDCFQFLEPSSVLMARATTWGTLLSNDVFDYVSDGISGRVANLCWAIGDRDSPIECARMFRGCLIALARTAHYDPGPLFALIYMEYTYLYTARYCYYSVPCDPDLPLDDTYIPYSFVDIPTPGTSPVHGFRAALREAFSPSVSNPPSDISDLIAPFSPSTKTNTANQSLPPWRGVAATPCAWDMASGDFDVTAMRATHEILACLDRQVYVDHPEVYRAHLGWMIRHYDSMVVAGRDNLGVGRYYIASRID
ncbi:hypothetical protein N7462_005809 [Penicillium macrosclerotiorum]|uniref:uncharacterized protein n=1 Tax=Penicillium macrosclerotiorum TaxID=303699 RepID=UPI0025479905|nr:uncharacterized protein N7462_005809 [Penicillium macrosclerotiorum]KAJ5682644.1 hypothetical protein N7462_005809 [Penicillium macrosclerotiorum]